MKNLQVSVKTYLFSSTRKISLHRAKSGRVWLGRFECLSGLHCKAIHGMRLFLCALSSPHHLVKQGSWLINIRWTPLASKASNENAFEFGYGSQKD